MGEREESRGEGRRSSRLQRDCAIWRPERGWGKSEFLEQGEGVAECPTGIGLVVRRDLQWMCNSLLVQGLKALAAVNAALSGYS